jgi:hypothetical protein
MEVPNRMGRPKNPNGRMICVSIVLPQEMIDGLKELASIRAVTVSILARKFISDGLDREKGNGSLRNSGSGEGISETDNP